MIDHVGGRGGLAAPRGRLRTAGDAVLRSFDLKPRIPQCFGKVVVNGSCDGHRVCHWLRLLVVLAQAPTEVLLHHRVAGSGSWTGEEAEEELFYRISYVLIASTATAPVLWNPAPKAIPQNSHLCFKKYFRTSS